MNGPVKIASLSTVMLALVVVCAGAVGLFAPRSRPARLAVASAAASVAEVFPDPIDISPKDIKTDPTVRVDYDIVYVRAPRKGDDEMTMWSDISRPAPVEPGADLMLLHRDGSEEVLVQGGEGAVTDPYVSFDGEWVLYSLIDGRRRSTGPPSSRVSADIYRIHVPTRQIVRLTEQPGGERAPGVLNLGPCPLPGGRVAFVSNRNGFGALQLFVMDDDGSNVTAIGAMNLGGALHPAVLTDGRIMFSSQESQGLRRGILWGLLSINPDGTGWEPIISAFDRSNAFHFQTQLSDGSIVAEQYYNRNNDGFGAYYKLPARAPDAYPAFGPADRTDPRNPPLRFGRFRNGRPKIVRMGFGPLGVEALTRFASNGEGLSDTSVLNDQASPRVGKVTHPSGAPDNHLLTVWTPGPANHQGGLKKPAVNGGLYLIKGGKPIDAPGEMLRIKDEPQFNEQWPRALVPYRRIYGIAEPKLRPSLANDGRLTAALPEGTPYGLVGTSSLYKRESYPDGAVPSGGVTAGYSGEPDPSGYEALDPFNTSENFASLNWQTQGADAGRYSNDDIHAIRIVAFGPTTAQSANARYRNHASERMRILGEIPVRKFTGAKQPVDPDGNPDTSFLARIPGDVAFTFQTLDRDGMVLNMAQTWHQVRPGEVRTDCGGCHAHSQRPTPFAATRAGQPGYVPADLSTRVPLITTKALDESGRRWDVSDKTGLRYESGPKSVEYFRDIKPILDKSCQACHSKSAPAAGLVLDDDTIIRGVPGTYYRLAMDARAEFGPKAVIRGGTWRGTNASRYIRKFQSRRSLLVWKIFGRRTDGWSNDDFPTETAPGDASTLAWHGAPAAATRDNLNRADLDYTGSPMPPAEAVAGTYTNASGQRITVAPLTDEDRLTIVRWIDLGCPIDLDHDAVRPGAAGEGWLADDQPPTLTVTYPLMGSQPVLSRLLIGMADDQAGLDMTSLTVVADFPVDEAPAGENLAPRFEQRAPGVWEFRMKQPVKELKAGHLAVSVKDREGNTEHVVRTFAVGSRSR